MATQFADKLSPLTFPDSSYFPPNSTVPPERPMSYPPGESAPVRLAELDCVARAVFDGDRAAAIRWLRDPYLNELAQMRFRGDVAAAWAWLEPTRHFVTDYLGKNSPEPESGSPPASPPASEVDSDFDSPDAKPDADPAKGTINHRARIEGLALILFGSDQSTALAWLLNAHLAALARLLFDGNVDAASEWLLPLREFARGVSVDSVPNPDKRRERRSSSPVPEGAPSNTRNNGVDRRSPSPSRRERQRERSSSVVRASIRPTSTGFPPTAALMMKGPGEEAPQEERLSHIRAGPPDNWVPTLDDRGFIDLPPPHELQLRPPTAAPTPGMSNAPPPSRLAARAPSQAPVIPSQSPPSAYIERPRHRTSRTMPESTESPPKEAPISNGGATRPPSQQSPPQQRRPQNQQSPPSTSLPKAQEKKSETWYRR